MRRNLTKYLDKDAKILILISGLYTVAIALSNTFVNVYLWKLEKDYLLIGWFNLFHYIAMFFTFIFSGKLAKKIDRVIIIRFGVIVLTVFYLAVLLLKNQTIDYYVYLGILLGIGQGLYWFAFNLLYFEITEVENRDNFNGWNGLFTSLGGIIAPFFSGWVIVKKGGLTGYNIIFLTSLIIFVIAALASFFLIKREFSGKYQLRKVLKGTFKNSNWGNMFLAMIAQGIREGVIIFLIGLLIYISTNNELSLGTYTMIISAITSVTYFIVGKYIKKNWRNNSMIIGTIIMAIVVIPMFLNINYKTLFIYGIGTSLVAPLYFVPLTSKTFDLIGKSEEGAVLRGEYIVLREIGLNIGRIFITILFVILVLNFGDLYLNYLLLFSSSVQILAGYFMSRVNI